MDRGDVLNARHKVASAAGSIAASAASVARALAWQVGDEAAVMSDLEACILHVRSVERQLVEAVTELRIATRTE